MATATTKSAAAKKAAARKTAASKANTSKPATTRKATGKGKTTAKPAADGPSKREALAEQNAANTERMLELRDAGESWSAIAEELNITPGKAQFLMMLHKVAEGEVPKIAWRNDGELTTKTAAARRKADEYSSWGWLAARTGCSEGKIKGLLEESGDYVPKSENISVIRAEKNGTTKTTAKKTPAKTAAAKTKATGASAKAAAAKKRAAARAGKAKSSS